MVLEQLPICSKPLSSYGSRNERCSQRVFVVDNSPGGAALRTYEEEIFAAVDRYQDLLGAMARDAPLTLSSGELMSRQPSMASSATSAGSSVSLPSPRRTRRGVRLRQAISARMHAVLYAFTVSPNLLMCV